MKAYGSLSCAYRVPLRVSTCPPTVHQVALYIIFVSITFAILLFFAAVPFYSAPAAYGERSLGAWGDLCSANDQEALKKFGLS